VLTCPGEALVRRARGTAPHSMHTRAENYVYSEQTKHGLHARSSICEGHPLQPTACGHVRDAKCCGLWGSLSHSPNNTLCLSCDAAWSTCLRKGRMERVEVQREGFSPNLSAGSSVMMQ